MVPRKHSGLKNFKKNVFFEQMKSDLYAELIFDSKLVINRRDSHEKKKTQNQDFITIWKMTSENHLERKNRKLKIIYLLQPGILISNYWFFISFSDLHDSSKFGEKHFFSFFLYSIRLEFHITIIWNSLKSIRNTFLC